MSFQVSKYIYFILILSLRGLLLFSMFGPMALRRKTKGFTHDGAEEVTTKGEKMGKKKSFAASSMKSYIQFTNLSGSTARDNLNKSTALSCHTSFYREERKFTLSSGKLRPSSALPLWAELRSAL